MIRQLNNKGFTLIELMVALTLLAIGIFAVLQMQIIGMQSSSLANKISAATGLANEVMEDIQSWDLDTPPVANLFDPPNGISIGNQTYSRFSDTRNQNNITIPSAGVYTATYNVTLIQPDRSAAFITVTVTGGGGRRVVLTSYRRIL